MRQAQWQWHGSCRLRSVHVTRNTVDPQRRPKARVVLACLLVLLLLWTQSIGLWHRVVHTDTSHPAQRWMGQASVTDARQAPSIATKLFSNHHADTDCQFFDQLSHADGVSATLSIAMGFLVLAELQRASHALAVARWHALFQARGPPSVR